MTGTFEELRLEGVSRSFSGNAALAGLDLTIRRGEFIALLGPSGCGKSTALNCLAGLLPLTSGSIWQDDTRLDTLLPEKRGFGMVFQNYALFPHLTVAKNIAFGLQMRRLPGAEVRRRTDEAIALVHLEAQARKLPGQLSGGQQQRVAIARAVVLEPSLVLMDEPLSNLDAKLRVQTRAQIAALQQRLGATTVYVTHDQVEAMTMGDRVAVLKDGILQQVDTPLNLYDRPRNLFVAGFIGSPAMNLLNAHSKEGRVRIGDYEIPVDRAAASKANGDITIGVRPESWRLVNEGEGLPVKVNVVEELGADGFVYGHSGVEGTPDQVIVRIDARRSHHKGDTIHVTTDPHHVHVFDTSTGARLSD